MYICKICTKPFKTKNALNGHFRIHKDNHVSAVAKTAKLTRAFYANKHKNAKIAYMKSPQRCPHCGNDIPFDKRNNKSCSRSCGASLSNLNRVQSKDTRQKISNSLKSVTRISKKMKPIIGPHSKLFIRTCAHCLIKFAHRRNVKYCNDHAHLYGSANRNRYAFTFNVYNYPNLFDLDKLQKIGWYSRGGKAGKCNIEGLTRDHKVSVSEAIRFNYDPFYITHPMNCELMPWLENNKKNTTSSISYSELIKLVDEYENKMAGLVGLEPTLS